MGMNMVCIDIMRTTAGFSGTVHSRFHFINRPEGSKILKIQKTKSGGFKI